MAASTAKKVWIDRFEREPASGFVNSNTAFTAAGCELLSPAGAISVLPWDDVKAVHFVRDFPAGGRLSLARKSFVSRPKASGLWLQMHFRDGDVLEGLLPNDLLRLDPIGYSVVPPDAPGNSQRLFIPRTSLEAVTVLGVIGAPARRAPAAKKAARSEDQIGLFGE